MDGQTKLAAFYIKTKLKQIGQFSIQVEKWRYGTQENGTKKNNTQPNGMNC
jgi:hypothetical protein